MKNFQLIRLSKIVLVVTVTATASKAATTLNGNYYISADGSEVGDLQVAGDFSVTGGLDFGIAASAPFAAVQLSYFGQGQKMATFDISDPEASFMWRQAAIGIVKNKMLLASNNILSLYKKDGDIEGFIIDPNNGRITVDGNFDGIYSGANPILKFDGSGLLSFGAQQIHVPDSTSSNSSVSGAFTVLGGIGVGKDSFINSIRLGRGNGNHVTNTAFGYESLTENTSGVRNTGFGVSVLSSNTIGSGNTVMGTGAMQNNKSGFSNSAVGLGALFANQTGDLNVAVGSNALGRNFSGQENTSIGSGALGFNYTGKRNTAIGANAGKFVVNGSEGIIDGRNNVFLGAHTRASSINEENAIVIGAYAESEGPNTTVIGNYRTRKTHLHGETETESLKVNGKTILGGQVILEQVHGDISMGAYQ